MKRKKQIKNNFLAFIPARGGSKRIKNKNLKNFRGKPLIFWTLKNSLNSKYIDKIIVSSDSNQILKYSNKILKNKFILSRRPKYLATDKSKVEKTLIYEIKKHKLDNFKYIVLLQPTSPLRSNKLLDSTLKTILKRKINSLVTVRDINKTKVIKKKFKKLIRLNFNRNLFISGEIYIFKTKNFLKFHKIITKDCYYFLSNGIYSDFDYPEEFIGSNK